MREGPNNRPPILVSFSGIDGAGKSTQIGNLERRLTEAGFKVRVLTFWDDVARLKRFREAVGHTVLGGDKGVGSPQAPLNRRDKNVRSPLMTLVRQGLYLIDALALRAIAGRAQRFDCDLVIFDRYLYDELANLETRSALGRFTIRRLMQLAPRPEISFVLDADPEQARARKPEYPIDFLHVNRRSYLDLTELLGGMVVIPPMPIEQAKQEVVSRVFQRLAVASEIG